MLRQRIVDVVVIGGRFDDGLATSVPLGEVVEVRVLMTSNRFESYFSILTVGGLYSHVSRTVRRLIGHLYVPAKTGLSGVLLTVFEAK